jgi:hypothetical protein
MDTIEEENPFGIQPLKGPHSPSIAPYTPAILVGETGCWKRVAKTEGYHHLYSSVGPPPRALRRAPIAPSVGPLSISVRHPCAFCWVPIHLPLGTRPNVRLPCSPIGYRGPPSSFRRASPSGHPIRPTV